MANVKQDLLNKIGIEKYYAELELGRLAQDPTMNYQEKINSMAWLLERIAVLNGEIGLANQYFPDAPVQPVQAAPQAAPAQGVQPHPGQTFAE